MATNFLGLACGTCRRVNYRRALARRKKGIERQKLETRKFCAFCRKHTVHVEKKWPK